MWLGNIRKTNTNTGEKIIAGSLYLRMDYKLEGGSSPPSARLLPMPRLRRTKRDDLCNKKYFKLKDTNTIELYYIEEKLNKKVLIEEEEIIILESSTNTLNISLNEKHFELVFVS